MRRFAIPLLDGPLSEGVIHGGIVNLRFASQFIFPQGEKVANTEIDVAKEQQRREVKYDVKYQEPTGAVLPSVGATSLAWGKKNCDGRRRRGRRGIGQDKKSRQRSELLPLPRAQGALWASYQRTNNPGTKGSGEAVKFTTKRRPTGGGGNPNERADKQRGKKSVVSFPPRTPRRKDVCFGTYNYLRYLKPA